jgi:hypothetical protein
MLRSPIAVEREVVCYLYGILVFGDFGKLLILLVELARIELATS